MILYHPTTSLNLDNYLVSLNFCNISFDFNYYSLLMEFTGIQSNHKSNPLLQGLLDYFIIIKVDPSMSGIETGTV